MENKKKFLKNKDLLLKIISICGMIYGICVLLLIIFVIAFSQVQSNINLKNIVILLGFLNLVTYLIQFSIALYLSIKYHQLLKSIQLIKKIDIEKWCWLNTLVIGCFIGYICFPFIIKIKLTTQDLATSHLPSKLNTFVKLDLPYDITNQKCLSDFINQESDNLNFIIDNVQNDEQEILTISN